MSDQPSAPIWTYRFQLGRDDVAAFENLPAEARGWRKFVMFAFAILAGGLWAFVEEFVFGDDPTAFQHVAALLAAIAIGWGLAALVLKLDKRRVIGRRPLPQSQTRVDIHADRIDVTEDGQTRVYLFEQMQWPIVTASHVFLQIGQIDKIILPLRAFDNEAAMRAFADWLDARMTEIDALQETNDVQKSS